MRASTLLYAGAAVALATGVGLTLQGRHEAARLKGALIRAERTRAERDRIAEEDARLKKALAYAGDLEALRKARQRMGNQRFAIAGLQLRIHNLNAQLGKPVEAVWPEGATVLPAKDWTYAGQGRPIDTIESVLWSARNGDTARLATLIAMAPGARKAADDLFAALPEAAKAGYGSADHLVATMIAATTPADYAAIASIDETESTPDTALLGLRLQDAHGNQRDLRFAFQRSDAGWQLNVPAAAVRRFASNLTGSDSLPAKPVQSP